MAINFFSGKKEFRSLSNFWENDVEIDGRIYQSGEHAFHGEKFVQLGLCLEDQERAKQLMDYAVTFMKPSTYTTAMAKKMGGKKGLTLNDEELQFWSRRCVEVQKKISLFKLRHEEVRNDLLKSTGKLLIHPAMRCRHPEKCFWEGKAVVQDGVTVVLGKNMLGNIWMDIRDTL